MQVKLGGIDHEVILVRLEEETWACDVGFGGQTCREPVLLCDPPLDWPDTRGKGEPLCEIICLPICHHRGTTVQLPPCQKAP